MVTQSCRKIPVQIQRKLPDEKCEEIPDIVCHLELESYEEPVCEMVPVEECEDIYKEIPFLVDDEECEDIPRLQCTEVIMLDLICCLIGKEDNYFYISCTELVSLVTILWDLLTMFG